jgi:NADH-quinone oxidoreductase subunit L
MLIGTLAITGVGLPHLDLGFAGFYSKDSIINAAYTAAVDHSNPLAGFAFFIGLFAAGLTSFYSWRLIFMTFHGAPKWAHADHGPDAHGHDDHGHGAQIETHSEPDVSHDAHGHGHGHGDHTPHESLWVVIVPLAVLAFGAVFAGGVFADKFIGAERGEFWRAAIFTLKSNHVLTPVEGPEWVLWAPLTVTALGFVLAWLFYVKYEGSGARIAARKGPLWSFLYNKWYFDEVYDFIFVRGAKALGDIFWKVGDQKLIDGLGPNGVAAVSEIVGKNAGKVQSGYVYHYAFIMLLGVAGLLSFALWAWR